MTQDGTPAPLIDVLHRVLWCMEHQPRQLSAYLQEVQANLEQLRAIAEALRGPVLKRASTSDALTAELSALSKLTANWQSLVEDVVMTAAKRDERTGQKHLDFGKEGGR